MGRDLRIPLPLPRTPRLTSPPLRLRCASPLWAQAHKKLVKEMKREKRRTKIPKHVKKRHRKLASRR